MFFLTYIVKSLCISFSYFGGGGGIPFFTFYAEVTLNSELKSGLYMLYVWGKRELARYQHFPQVFLTNLHKIPKVQFTKSDDLLNRTKLALFMHASVIKCTSKQTILHYGVVHISVIRFSTRYAKKRSCPRGTAASRRADI